MLLMFGTRERGSATFLTFLVILFVSIIAAGLIAFSEVTKVNPFERAFFEEDPPVITWVQEPLGLGADPVSLSLKVTDSGSGLDEVLVRIFQNNQPRDLVRKRALAGSKAQDITVDINPKELGLREGKAELQILAFDQSLWSNGSKVLKSLSVDFLKPRIEVITPQQNGVIGGSELVYYKVIGKRPDSQGVFSDGVLYPGLPAKYWDESFKHYDDLYLAFFPIPQNFDESKDAMSLLARDSIGNSATASFNYRTRSRRWGSFTMNLTPAKAEEIKNYLAAHPSNEAVKARLSGDLVTDLRYLIKTSARHDESVLSDPLSRTEGRKLWEGAFMRPLTVYPSNSAGDLRTITFEGQEILKGPAVGARFQVSTRQRVVAANSGRVSFVDTLPMNGITVIVDHGFGLATVYAHLSEATVKPGEEIAKGQQIGLTGSTGMAQAEEVYFETRLHGVPVSPNEWWDDTWVSDHIQNKTGFVQRSLIGEPGE
jgi:murein DD-endopeptidase MepM/ murein hydrolase activator NlpD